MEITLKTSGEHGNYARNEWRTWKLHSRRVENMEITLETGGKDLFVIMDFASLLSNLPSESLDLQGFQKTTLETSGEDAEMELCVDIKHVTLTANSKILHSFRV
jgi:hypothetical protein